MERNNFICATHINFHAADDRQIKLRRLRIYHEMYHLCTPCSTRCPQIRFNYKSRTIETRAVSEQTKRKKNVHNFVRCAAQTMANGPSECIYRKLLSHSRLLSFRFELCFLIFFSCFSSSSCHSISIAFCGGFDTSNTTKILRVFYHFFFQFIACSIFIAVAVLCRKFIIVLMLYT